MVARTPFTVRATGSSPGGMVADEKEIRRAVEVFFDDSTYEVMSLTSGIHRFVKGDSPDGVVEAVKTLPGGIGVYFRINPVKSGLTGASKAGDILSRRWLYIDVDPVKEESHKDNPATDEERERTATVCNAVNEHLDSHGWPTPVVVESGNGYGLFYRCELPNDKLTQATYRNLLNRLSGEFSGQNGTIDKSVHNANRLAKLPGTWAKKGTPSDDRPHRVCRIVSVPAVLECVTFEMLSATAGQVEGPSPSTNGTAYKATPTNRIDAYGRSALDKECARVVLARGSGEGRNNALNRAAFSLGGLVAGDVLHRDDVEGRLYEAACEAGLDKDPNCGERGIWNTIRSGIEAGLKHPRTAPERNDPRPTFTGNRNLTGSTKDGELLTIKLSHITPAKVEWLVKDRIPKRFITVFAGQTGVGKSFVSLDLVARISNGGEIPLSGGECFNQSGTLIISEDSHEYVLAPRLIEAGADMNRIHAMTWKAMSQYNLGNTDMLTQAVSEIEGGVSLVMIDPPTNFLEGTDEHKNSEVRQLVMRVVEWALSRDLAVIFILHVNKPSSAKGVAAINRVMGSVAWVTTSRIAHSFCQNPDDPKTCLWAPLKNNLGKIAKAIEYRITPHGEDQALVEWIGEVDMTADEAMGNNQPRQRRDIVASEWLVEKFREKLEWRSDELMREATESNVSRNALFEAKKLLDLPKARKVTLENGDGVWWWWVPADWPPLQIEATVPS